MIASGRSERGLSEVTHTRSHEPRGDLAHDRTLAAVAVAAAAEDDAEPAARELARGGQHALERVGRVGVVDDHEERLAGPHLLEAARARCRPPPSARGDGRAARGPARARSPTAPSRFITLCSPMSGDASVSRPRGVSTVIRMPASDESCSTARTRAPAPRPKRQDGHVEPRAPSPPRPDRRRSPRPCARASASRRGARTAGAWPSVRLERAVEVEVVLGQVGEHRHVEREPVGAGERQRVRRHLHRHAAARRARACRASIDCSSSASGVVWLAGPRLVAEHVLDRADDARARGRARAAAPRPGRTSWSCRWCR